MHLDVTDSPSHQAVLFEEAKRLLVVWHDARGKRRNKTENLIAIPDLAAGQFTDDEWMGQDVLTLQCRLERRNALMEMIDPDGCVDEDQEERRLRGAFAPGSLPPRRARRRALSRAISARKPS